MAADQTVGMGDCAMAPRDVLAERIEAWVESADAPYTYADALINALDRAGWEFAPSSCFAEGCTVELGAYCERHGYVLYGADQVDPRRKGRPTMERTDAEVDQLRSDILAVLTVYDEHVAPENRGPWRERLETFADDLTMGVMERIERDHAEHDGGT